MAPINSDSLYALKRTSTDAGHDAPAPSKHRIATSYHHHSLRWKQDLPAGISLGACQDEAVIQSLLVHSIVLALESIGFEHADPVALESFRAGVEEYMAHFLASVRCSMLSCRRTQAIAQDFIYALNAHNLTLRSLLPHLDPPISPEKSQPRLSAQPASDSEDQRYDQLILKLLDSPKPGSKQGLLSSQVPQHFPALPSRHTYRFEEMYTKRETDARKVRERATEEGRLGEEALRKLVSMDSERRPPAELKLARGRPTVQEKGRALWRETMEAIMKEEAYSKAGQDPESEVGNMEWDLSKRSEESNVGYSSSAVNADRRYWRKGATQKAAGPVPHSESGSKNQMGYVSVGSSLGGGG